MSIDERIDIEIQRGDGTWMKIANTENSPQLIAVRLNGAQQQYPGKRVRAVNSKTGAVVDIRN